VTLVLLGILVDLNLADECYHIAEDQANKIYLPGLLKDPQNTTDPVFKVCIVSTIGVHI
jgi:hypothetical protein